MPVSSGGPWVASAVFCERVLHEADGVLSLIRIVDRFTQSAAGPNPPAEMPPFPLDVWAVIVLKADQALGRHTIRIRPEAPSGERLAVTELPVLFEGGDRGAALLLNVQLALEHEGLYWFDVLHGEQETPLTRMPLRLVYEPRRIATQ